jgi:hypothetical protein
VGNKFTESIRSEPAKWLPIGCSSLALLISFLGLLISFLGWRDAHQGRLINEAVNRPVVTIQANGKGFAVPEREGSTKIVKKVVVTSEIKNLGKTSAVINKIDHSIDYFQECLLTINQPWTEDHEADFKALVGKEVPSSVSSNVFQIFAIRPECPNKNIFLVSHGVIYYTDIVTGASYTQDFINSVTVPDPTPTSSPSIGRP